MNAWKCACQTTDRDLETKKVNAWICAPPTSDHDPANVIVNKICNNCNACNVCNFFADLLFSI